MNNHQCFEVVETHSWDVEKISILAIVDSLVAKEPVLPRSPSSRLNRTLLQIPKQIRGKGRMQISVVGAGYVGLTTAACLAEIGHQVLCADNDLGKLEKLNSGRLPFYEPHLDRWSKPMSLRVGCGSCRRRSH